MKYLFVWGSTIFVCFLMSIQHSIAQTENTDSTKRVLPGVLLFDFQYGFQVAAGDMAENFYNNSAIIAQVGYMFPNNWTIGTTAEYKFNERIRQDIIAPLRNESGDIINSLGQAQGAEFGLRGFYIGGRISKLFPVMAKNERSGIEISVGAGYLQHWIRIKTDGEYLPQLTPEYKKGYDRKTSGLALQQFIGYRHLGKRRLANLFIGVETTQGFTKNRRAWNFDTMGPDNRKRIDLLWGFRAGISLPIYIHSLASLEGEVWFY